MVVGFPVEDSEVTRTIYSIRFSKNSIEVEQVEVARPPSPICSVIKYEINQSNMMLQ